MKKINRKFRKAKNFKKRGNIKKAKITKSNKKFLVKFLSFIFLSLFFLYLQIKFKNSIEIKEQKKQKKLKEQKEDLIHQIHIAISSDNKYIYPSIVFLTSLLDNRAESTYYIIHVLFNDYFSKHNINKIKTIVDNFGKNHSEVVFHNLGNDFRKATITIFGISTYYRVALPSLLPNVDRIIYIDGDSLNIKDLTEMYNIKLKKDMYISAILDRVSMIKEIKELGIETNKYVNAGVLLMDLKTMREKSIEKKMRDFIATHYLKMCDQTLINAICNNNIQIMPYKYAVPPLSSYEELVKYNSEQESMYKVSESELYQAYHDPTLLHFFGPNKLWNKNCNHTYRVYWWYYAKMSGFYNEILNHFSSDMNSVEDLLKQIPSDGGLLKHNYKKLV